MKVVTLDSIVSVIRARREYRGFLAEFINECKIADAIPIPEGATKGEMMQAMFDVEIVDEFAFSYGVKLSNSNYVQFNKDWWDSPYKPKQTLAYADQSGMEFADAPTLQSAT